MEKKLDEKKKDDQKKRKREPEKKKEKKAKKKKYESDEDESGDDDSDNNVVDSDDDCYDGFENLFKSNTCDDEDDSTEVRQLLISGMPLGSHISETQQKRIFKEKYIDLAKLLPQLESSRNLNNLIIDQNKKIKVRSNIKSIDSIDMWRKAFDTLIAIFASKKDNADRVPGMLQYAHEIEGLQRDGYDWQTYDKSYRLERANQVIKPCWSETNQRLYNATIRKGKVSQISKSNNYHTSQSVFSAGEHKSERIPRTPVGYCYAFHSFHKRCSTNPCQWSHKCFICPDSAPSHPIYKCRSISSKNSRGDFRRNEYQGGSHNSGEKPSFANKRF